MGRVRVAVVGAGVVGLSTALCIAECIPKCSVTVLADTFSPDTVSDGAAGFVYVNKFPDTPVDRQRRWLKDTFDHLFSISNSSEAPDAGVYLISGFKNADGQVQPGRVTDFGQLCVNYDIIVNCSGLGSLSLVGDTDLHPVRGQILKVQAPWLKHFIRDGDGLTYIFPGISSVTLGGTRQKDDWRLTADPKDCSDMFERCCALEPSLKKSQVLTEWVGLRPSRGGLRLEKEMFQHGSRQVPIIHNYGHGGGGISLHWGTALEATQLVKECIGNRYLASNL
ncbi:D-aspartate oxidase [Acipenser ruthenus]|uniref:D-aspartate oxidase n=1 Tax=Acipenser ruthenus TaxID=7906 RepID=A0A662YXS5_ACIRT|nr:D-aspartate oxidase [Acipenser ruthenus]